MKKIFIVGILAIIFNSVYAQDSLRNKLINSGQILGEGIAFHDKELYDSAISRYDLIDRNDTNYYTALYEKSFTLLQKKDYAGSIKVLREALKNPNEETVEMYMNLGTALDDSGNADAAIKVYEQALQYYPYLCLLHYNYALTLNNQKRYKEAIAQYQNAILLNSFHASSYLALGNLYYTQGRKIPALLTLGMFLVLEPHTERSLTATKLLKKIAEGSMDQDKNVVVNIPEEDKKYSYLTEILDSKVANDKRYKTGVDVNDILVRQFHVVLDNLKFDKNDTTFLSVNIIAYMKDMFTSGNYEPFVYFMFSSYNNDMINKWINKNEKRIAEFKKWSGLKIVDIHAWQTLNIDGKQTKVRCYFRDNGRLQSFGQSSINDGKEIRQGKWMFLALSGNVETLAYYNDKGEADGECKVWFKNRKLYKDFKYKNDEQDGQYLQYFENGSLKYKANYVKGLIEGNLYKYYNTGSLKSVEPFIHDTLHGIATYYKPSGAKSAILKAVKGQTDSLGVYYFQSGKVQSTSWFKNDKRNGKSIFYYESGKVQSTGDYKDDEQVGQWLTYWENGKLKSDVTYSQDGKMNGSNKQYFENGTLNEEFMYVNGKSNGKSAVYNEDASLWYNVDYKNGAIKRITTYTSKTGAVCADYEDKGKRIPVVFMTPKCEKSYEGMFFDGERDGAWKHFYTNGNVSIEEKYKKGNRNGIYTKYFKIGSVDSKVNYINDKADGYYNEYYQSGVKFCEGWYRNDQKQGYWKYYGPTGIIKKELYYLNDDLRGFQRYYTVDGKLDYEMFYKNDLIADYIYYDTTGNVVSENKIENGNGHILGTYCNGKKMFEGEMKNGNFNGTFKRYYSNGTTFEISNYINKNLDGQLKQFYRNGAVLRLGNYVNGEAEGKTTWYYKNGKKEVEGNYKKDDKDGTWEWFDELGRKSLAKKYKEGNLEGDQIWYDSTGTAMMKLVYEDDDLVAYSYLDNSKTFLPNIPIQNETAKIKTLYPNGKVAAEIEYSKGVIVGDYKTYYQNGQVMESIPYKNNKVNGLDKSYYETGKLRSEENYTYGNKHGKCTYYRPNGNLEKIEIWYLDQKHGVFEYFDVKGTLVKKENYVYDELFE